VQSLGKKKKKRKKRGEGRGGTCGETVRYFLLHHAKGKRGAPLFLTPILPMKRKKGKSFEGEGQDCCYNHGLGKEEYEGPPHLPEKRKKRGSKTTERKVALLYSRGKRGGERDIRTTRAPPITFQSHYKKKREDPEREKEVLQKNEPADNYLFMNVFWGEIVFLLL